MIPQEFEYAAPQTVNEVLDLLAKGAKPLAGGMSLIPMMKLRLATPEHLADLGRVKELAYIREDGGEIHRLGVDRGPDDFRTNIAIREPWLHIGATTTHYAVESSALVRSKCPLLAETASQIGDVQVRNRGTIGGSVAHADPSADYPAALQALGAELVIRGANGERRVAIDEFLVDTFTTSLEPGEIIREVIVPVESNGAGVCYQKVAQKASGFAMVGIGVRIKREGDKLAMVRIGVTGLSNRAYRATHVEKALEGRTGKPAEIEAAAALVTQGAEAIADIHASATYRAHLAVVHAGRAIAKALARAV